MEGCGSNRRSRNCPRFSFRPRSRRHVADEDLTFSTFRRFAKIEPGMFAIPPGGGYSLKIFAPVGGSFEPSLWSSVTYYQSGKPAVAEDGPNGIFSAQGGGLKRRLDEALSAERIDKLKQPDSREHFEVWVRWDFRAIMLASPDSFHIPKWRQQIDPTSEGAAEAMSVRSRAPNERHPPKASSRCADEAKSAERRQKLGRRGRFGKKASRRPRSLRRPQDGRRRPPAPS